MSVVIEHQKKDIKWLKSAYKNIALQLNQEKIV
jgi:ribosome biogenesis SPOUT family RNA methylase Rps3